jgi:hypothetical protein
MGNRQIDRVLVYPGQGVDNAVEEYRDRTGYGGGVFIRLVDANGNRRSPPRRHDADED